MDYKMVKYFEINPVEISGQCPLYENCRSGRDLPPEFCAKYRCNTFYNIDTIDLYLKSPWGPKAIAECGRNGQNLSPPEIVRTHLDDKIGQNGHCKNGNGSNGRLKLDSRKTTNCI